MLTKEQIEDVAIAHGYEYAELKCFIDVESSGNSFDKLGNLMIQFEPTVFAKWLERFSIIHGLKKQLVDIGNGKTKAYYTITAGDITLTNTVDVQSKELEAYNLACQISEAAALLSTSWGLPQILGQNYALAGYKTAREMVEDFKQSEVRQLHALCTFLDKTGIKKHLQNNDWETVARMYNGRLYKQFDYHIKLAKAYEKARKEE